MSKFQKKLPVVLKRVRLVALSAVVVISAYSIANIFTPAKPVEAATSSTLNFQARLLTSAGSLVPDGNYNVEFKIYNAATSSGSSQGSCTGDTNCLWTETRVSLNKVRVANGYLTVNLGSVTAFPSINWDQELWLSMNIGGTGTVSWDGEMTPRLKMTAVPYAFRAGQLAKNSGGNQATLDFTTPTANRSILLPDESGTVCLQNASSCGFLTTATANSSYIQLQGSSPGTAQTGNFNISGTGIAGTLQAATLDTPSGTTTLNIGTTNATAGINLNQNTLVTASDSTQTAFRVQNASGVPMFTVDNLNYRVLIGKSATGSQSVGLSFTNSSNSNKVTLLADVNTSSSYQLQLPVALGTDGQCLKQTSTSGSTASLVFSSCGAAGSFIQDTTTVQSANFYVQAATSGSVAGTLRANAAGSGDILDLLNGSGTAVATFGSTGTVLFKNSTNSTAGFQVQAQNSNPVLTVDTTNERVGIGIVSPISAKLHVATGSTTTIRGFQGGTSNLFELATSNNGVASDTNVHTVDYQGHALYQNIANSTTAFQIQNSAGTSNLFVADTSNTRIGIGKVPTTTLDVNGTSTFTGALTQSGGTFSLQGSGASSLTTTSGGALTITAAAASTWSTSAGNLTVQAAGTSSLNLQTGGAGAVNIGVTNTTTIAIGNSSNIARTIGIGNTGASQAQAITIGNTGGSSATTIQGGTGSSAISLATGTNGSINLTANGTGKINFATNSSSGQFFFQSNTNSANALQVKASGFFGATVFNVDTSNTRIGINNTSPGYTLDVSGDANVGLFNSYRVGGTAVCNSGGCTPAAGSNNYIQNTSGPIGQSANIYITSASGSATVARFQSPFGGTGNLIELANGIGTVMTSVNAGGSALFKTTTNDTTGLQVQNSSSATVLDVDTTNSRVGIGTASPSRTLDVAINNTQTTAPMALLEQAGTGDVSLELKSPSKSFIVGLDGSDSSNFKISSSTASATSSTFGYTTVGGSTDSGERDTMSCSEFTSGGVGGTIASVSVHVGNVDSAPNNQYQVAVYTDNGGSPSSPGTRLGNSSSGTLTANSWNTISVSASIAASTTYWLCYYTNASTNGLNNMHYDTGVANQATWSAWTGSWPSTYSADGHWDAKFSIYATYTTGGAYDSFNAALFNLTDTGQATFKNSSDSSQAFQVQNAAGTGLLTVDTSNSRVFVGPAAGSTAPPLLVVSNKTDAGDPTGVAGAMYYNSTMGKFRCYEDGAWRSCLGFDADDKREYPFFSNDFMSSGNSGTLAFVPWMEGGLSSGTLDSTAGESGHPGIVRMSSSANANSGWRILSETGSAPDNILLNGGEAFEAVIKPITTTNTTTRLGYLDTTSSGDAADGAYIEIAGTTLRGKIANNSSRTNSSTTYTVSGSTWYRVKLVIADNASSVTYYVYNSSGTQLWTSTATATVPTASGRGTGSGLVTTNSAGGSANLVDLDYIAMWWPRALSR